MNIHLTSKLYDNSNYIWMLTMLRLKILLTGLLVRVSLFANSTEELIHQNGYFLNKGF
jgi:hypothetical protein